MRPAILGQKIGMTRVFDESGTAIPVTVIQAGPCTVLQVKTRERDGYEAVQVGFADVKPHRSTKPQIGHCATAGTGPKRFIREIRLDAPAEVKPGDVLTVEQFAEGVNFVDVIGTTKGRGYQGVMRRYGFGGQPASHGTERKHRSPGSIASHAANRGTGGKPKRGKRMSGQMGNVRRTVKSQRLVGVKAEENLLLVRGGIPGANGGFVLVQQARTRN